MKIINFIHRFNTWYDRQSIMERSLLGFAFMLPWIITFCIDGLGISLLGLFYAFFIVIIRMIK